MKKLISILLTVAMISALLVAVVPASAADAEKKATVSANHVPADFDGDGATDSGVIAIGTVADFKKIEQGKKYYLTSDLVIKAGQDGVTAGKSALDRWTNNGFYFDGCGHTIEFDKNAGTAATAISLFEGSAATIYIKNLNVTGVINASPATGDDHVSALARSGGSANLENVVVDVDITINSMAGKSAVGGIWSKTEYGSTSKFKNVHFTGSINVKCAPPVSGWNEDVNYDGIGGVVGRINGELLMEDCSNSGNITVGYSGMTVSAGINNFGLGGVIGVVGNKGANKSVKILRTSNSGNLEVIDLNNGHVGGIVGYAKKTNLYVDMCENSGTIKGNNNSTTADSGNIHIGLGGILGSAYNLNSTCKIEIFSSKNSGKISTSGNAHNIYAGGIAGRFSSVAYVNIVDCSNTAEIDNSKGSNWSSAGGIVGTYMTIGNTMSWSKIPSSEFIINKCQNSAKITSGVWAAGIIASGIQLYEDEIDIKISYCNNAGEINAGLDSTLAGADHAAAGGITGYLGWDISDSYEQFGNLTMEYCSNRAKVTAGPSAVAAGGVIGYMNGDSLVGVRSSGAEQKEANQKTYAGKTFDYYTQRTWIDYCGSDGDITCQNASGKVGAVAGYIANRYYLWNAQAVGSRILGSANATTNAWLSNTNWVEQAGNDQNSGKMSSLASSVTAPIAKTSELVAVIKEAELSGKTGISSQLTAAYNARLGNDITAMTNAIGELNKVISLDYSRLEAAIAAAEALNQSDYTSASWTLLQAILAEARAAKASASQSIVDNATASLTDAIASLSDASTPNPYPPAGDNDDNNDNNNDDNNNDDNNGGSATPNVDYSGLEAALTAAEALDESGYTAESWEALVDAIVVAVAALDSDDQTEIDAAASALNAAVAALVTTDNGADGDAGENDEKDEGDKDNSNDDAGETKETSKDSGASSNKDTESDEDDSEESGCGSAIAASSVALVVALTLGFGLKKKED